eukprot:scaffold1595_cov119-Isochrysis_galbana.AAC.5
MVACGGRVCGPLLRRRLERLTSDDSLVATRAAPRWIVIYTSRGPHAFLCVLQSIIRHLNIAPVEVDRQRSPGSTLLHMITPCYAVSRAPRCQAAFKARNSPASVDIEACFFSRIVATVSVVITHGMDGG